MANATQKDLTTKFIKQADYKTISVDGVLGGFNSSGKLNMNFYVDSIAIPDKVVIKIDQQTGLPIQSNTAYPIESNEMIKEIPLTISMNYPLSKILLNWLADQIRTFENANPQIKD